MSRNRYMSALKIAASAAVLSLAPSLAQAAECFDRNTDDPKAGNATAVVGPLVNVDRQNADGLFRPASGADMFSGDTVSTGDDSHMQLKLCDWSTYTFSPNSESQISEFFDARGAGRRRVVNFFRGGFRFSSGRDTEPGATEVEIQETGVTMGVRGTNVILAEIDGVVYALLEGPVRDNTGLAPKGLVQFWTDDNRDAIEAVLKRPGFAVRIGPDGVSEPFRADPELLRRIYQAFVPVVPEGDGTALEYAGNALGDSGQGAQEAETNKQNSEDRNDGSDEQTEQKPEQPFDDEEDDPQDPQDPMDPMDPPPMTIDVGEILPLDVLDDFAGRQAAGDGHILALAPAQLFTDDGSGQTLQDEGVALIQIHVDWSNRTVAPEALASFIKLDFSVSDPNDLTVDDFDFNVPDEIENAYLAAVLQSYGVPFANGDNDLAVFLTEMFTFTIRQGVGDTVTADVDIDVSAEDGQGVTYIALGAASDLEFLPGEGQLAFFDSDLGFAATTNELAGVMSSGTSTLSGSGDRVISTLGSPQFLSGVSFAQIEVNFDNRTVGGGNSFIAVTAESDPTIGGQVSTTYISLDQTASIDSGLFGLAFYPLGPLSSNPDLLKGQAIFENIEGLGASIASILADEGGNHLYSDLFLFNQNRAGSNVISTIAGLEAQAGALGTGTFFYDGTSDGPADSFANLQTPTEFGFGDAEASIDINFANRTLGGGSSYVSVDVTLFSSMQNVNFTEMLNAVSFDDAASGVGVFGFDGSDFSGNNITSMLLLLRDGAQVGAGETADLYFNFTAAGGQGRGEIEGMPLTVPNP
ncbi:FecR domain-containing protein [Hyphococcus flavus]|uniref:FecR domain-containing protein n=1 Tax=Hyphococcus flavus TaxID=1866326 RepID=A0AAE9ZE25_9PROT|nr:FecR domain-containing protein [Hyphococcus flavus]WDI31297.1 FecR domain-containing protein [Hyphococcus flavus]